MQNRATWRMTNPNDGDMIIEIFKSKFKEVV